MKKVICTIFAIIMMAIGLVAPTNATKAEAAGNTVADMVRNMKEHNDDPNITGLACCSGVWLTYKCGRIINYSYASESMGTDGMLWIMKRSLETIIGDPD